MKLTKYDHACVTLENDGQMIVIDPGNLSTDFISPHNVVGVVITHAHADHFDPELVASIIDANPDATIVSHEAVTSQIEAFTTHPAQAGDTLKIGAFDLAFFGGTHATIHRSIPIIPNLSIMVNDLFYYPGDSFTLPGKPVDTLAIPAGAPWLKIGDAMDFLGETKPRFAFPTHDVVLSDAGKGMADRLFGTFAAQIGTEYKRLDSPIEI
jgi:L-ascorbate metabolism protein UlaG (beta-lactamase superfamily)